jgi:hypothetical protein
MSGDEQQDVKSERIPLPPPIKRRDLHMRRIKQCIVTIYVSHRMKYDFV